MKYFKIIKPHPITSPWINDKGETLDISITLILFDVCTYKLTLPLYMYHFSPILIPLKPPVILNNYINLSLTFLKKFSK